MSSVVTTTKVRVPMEPWTPQPEITELFTDFFSARVVEVSETPFRYDTPQDFGKVIRKILLPISLKGWSSRFVKNMKLIGPLEGFEVEQVGEKFYPRDVMVVMNNSKVLITHFIEAHKEINRGLQDHIKGFEDYPCVVTDHPFFQHLLGGVGERRQTLFAFDMIPHDHTKRVRSYIEGGAFFLCNNQFNVPQALVANHLAIATHQSLHREEWFLNTFSHASIREKTVFQNVDDPVNQSVLLGEIPQIIQQLSVRILDKITADEARKNVTEIMYNTNSPYIQSTCEQQLQELENGNDGPVKQTASRYAAELEYVKTILFPIELEMKPEHVHFMAHAGYHPDLYVTPFSRGRMLLQDYSLSYQVLKRIKRAAHQLNLTEEEKAQLDSLLHTTKALKQDLVVFMKTIHFQLVNAGFDVIPTPGVFFGYNADGTQNNINFLNAITGFSPKNQRYYFICSGFQGRVAEMLMSMFARFVQCLDSDIEIVTYFTGRKGSDPTNFEEGTRDLNTYFCGPHCLTNEIETEAHIA